MVIGPCGPVGPAELEPEEAFDWLDEEDTDGPVGAGPAEGPLGKGPTMGEPGAPENDMSPKSSPEKSTGPEIPVGRLPLGPGKPFPAAFAPVLAAALALALADDVDGDATGTVGVPADCAA